MNMEPSISLPPSLTFFLSDLLLAAEETNYAESPSPEYNRPSPSGSIPPIPPCMGTSFTTNMHGSPRRMIQKFWSIYVRRTSKHVVHYLLLLPNCPRGTQSEELGTHNCKICQHTPSEHRTSAKPALQRVHRTFGRQREHANYAAERWIPILFQKRRGTRILHALP